MPWTKEDYPQSMKNLPAKTRDKAIEIGNALVDDGYDEGRAIPIAVSQAEKWADGSSPDDSHSKEEYHVVSDEQGWMVKKEGSKRASYRFETKQEAVEKGRELVRNNDCSLVVHLKDGSVENTVNSK
ncbi:DUF2188 domain-containing protein [Metabacillus indicus]|uniref:DUF2188 domain-containing protein n=1 Tax=Metabacillus indicus TaxID=246786 RepID=UPI00249038E2|nr:DUF2188 domain-containing protein [Metabacillus indicus]